MGRQLLIRLFQTFVSLIGMSILIFALVRVSGDPVDLMRTPTTTEAEIANIKAQWGLDKSLSRAVLAVSQRDAQRRSRHVADPAAARHDHDR